MSLGRVVHGAKCQGAHWHGASCPWGELSMGRYVKVHIGMGRVVHGASCDGASCPWVELRWGELSMGRVAMGRVVRAPLEHLQIRGGGAVDVQRSHCEVIFTSSKYLSRLSKMANGTGHTAEGCCQ
jgi:hypothetical protein